VAAAQLFPSYF